MTLSNQEVFKLLIQASQAVSKTYGTITETDINIARTALSQAIDGINVSDAPVQQQALHLDKKGKYGIAKWAIAAVVIFLFLSMFF